MSTLPTIVHLFSLPPSGETAFGYPNFDVLFFIFFSRVSALPKQKGTPNIRAGPSCKGAPIGWKRTSEWKRTRVFFAVIKETQDQDIRHRRE